MESVEMENTSLNAAAIVLKHRSLLGCFLFHSKCFQCDWLSKKHGPVSCSLSFPLCRRRHIVQYVIVEPLSNAVDPDGGKKLPFVVFLWYASKFPCSLLGWGCNFKALSFICTFKLFEGPRTLWTSSTGSISEYCFVLLTPKWWHRNFFAFTLLQTCWNTSFSNLSIISQSLRYAGIIYYCSNLPLFICAQVAHTRQFIALDSASFCSPR